MVCTYERDLYPIIKNISVKFILTDTKNATLLKSKVNHIIVRLLIISQANLYRRCNVQSIKIEQLLREIPDNIAIYIRANGEIFYTWKPLVQLENYIELYDTIEKYNSNEYEKKNKVISLVCAVCIIIYLLTLIRF